MGADFELYGGCKRLLKFALDARVSGGFFGYQFEHLDSTILTGTDA